MAQEVGRLGEQDQALVRVDDVLEERGLLLLALGLPLPSSLDAPDIQSRHGRAASACALDPDGVRTGYLTNNVRDNFSLLLKRSRGAARRVEQGPADWHLHQRRDE